MGVSRRGFLGTSAATVSAAVLARTAGAQHHAPQDRPGAKADQKPVQKRRAGPRTLSEAYGASLVVVIEGLCMAVTDPPKGGSDRKLDVGLVSTRNLKNPNVHEHLPTLSIDRGTIQEVTGIPAAGADGQNTFFNLTGHRIRFVGANAPGLSINDSVAVTTRCPNVGAEWANLNWLLDFRSEVDKSAGAALLSSWRSKADDLAALVEFRNGSVEDASLITPEIPGNDSAPIFNLPSVGKQRGLKEQIRVLIAAQEVEIHVWPLGATTGRPSGVIKLNCGTTGHLATVSHLPYKYEGESHNAHDLEAIWLLTEGGAAHGSQVKGNLPQLLEKEDPCTVGSTDGCGCCPVPRFIEVNWQGLK